MKNYICRGLLIAALGASGTVSAQGLVHAKQVIFGMDCAPCAYGVEKGLKGLPGVRSVSVSLNDGYAVVSLAPNSKTSLADIRRIIRKNGFTPKDAQVQLEGTLQLAPPRLATSTGTYALAFDRAGRPASILQGQVVTVRGSVASDSTDVHVDHMDPIVH